jgi:hypothetical protein
MSVPTTAPTDPPPPPGWLQGALVFSAATPGTVLLGLTQALLPAIVADLMSWVMVAWIMGVTCAHYAAAAVGLGWVGLLAPQVAVLVSGFQIRILGGGGRVKLLLRVHAPPRWMPHMAD